MKRKAEVPNEDAFALLMVNRGRENNPKKRRGTFKCKLCEMAFTGRKAKQEHEANLDGLILYRCDTVGCTYGTSFRGNLVKHKRVHSDEKPFVCEIQDCGKRFKSSPELRNHLQRHSDTREYQCGKCGLQLKTNGDLQQHKRVHQDAQHECSICNKKVKTSAALADHLRTHANERNFKCATCGKGFNTQSTLRTHRKIHEGVRSIACPQCPKMWLTKGALNQHIRHSHDLTAKFPCTVEWCGFAARSKGNLIRHTKSYHTEEGQQKKKRQEYEVQKVLKEHFVVDSQVFFSYDAKCVENPDRKVARVDFTLPEILKYAVIVECYERQHSDLPIRCEVTRMLQIQESLMNSGDSRPVIFVRYSPNSMVLIDGTRVRISRSDREATLVRLLQDIQNDRLQFSKLLTVIYLFYNMTNDSPSILNDSEYDANVAACVETRLCGRGLCSPSKR